MSNYLRERQLQKLGLKPTSAQEKRDKPKKPLAKKSAKTIEREKQAKANGTADSLTKFYDAMIACAPEKCQESGVRLNYRHSQREVVCHILPKRAVKDGGVPSQAQNPVNIVYLNIDIHTKMDADLGPKSKGKYVTKMKIFPLLRERVAKMWDSIKEEEKKNIPQFLQP